MGEAGVPQAFTRVVWLETHREAREYDGGAED